MEASLFMIPPAPAAPRYCPEVIREDGEIVHGGGDDDDDDDDDDGSDDSDDSESVTLFGCIARKCTRRKLPRRLCQSFVVHGRRVPLLVHPTRMPWPILRSLVAMVGVAVGRNDGGCGCTADGSMCAHGGKHA